MISNVNPGSSCGFLGFCQWEKYQKLPCNLLLDETSCSCIFVFRCKAF